MKRFVAVLSGLLVMPAFAEVAPVYYDDVIEYSDAEMYDGDVVVDDEFVVEDEQKNVAAPSVPARNTNRSSSRATRSLPTASTSGVTTRASNTAPSRAVASRAAANISQTRSAMTRGTATRGAASRAATSQNVSTRRVAQTTSPATTARAGAVSITQTDTVNTPLYTGRVGTRTVGAASVRARVPSVRVSNTVSTEATPVTVEDVTTSMDELAQITDFCKAQYTECMDNFCNVLDDNQGRCSCSKNVKNYAKTEEALKAATENLQDVAQKIQYIGLTGDEIDTLFAQTEAEMQMQGSSDSSQIKNDLDKIKNMIVDVKSGTASSSEISSGISMDLSGLLDFNIGSTGFDLSGLFGTTTTNTSSISNQRGEELYKTAASRCKAAVLNNCAAQGVDIAVITNSYDLEIDKQCVAYERSLTDANDQMRATVRNAQSVLQKARLMVAQQKNSYDLRGCVNALDSCMQDDFVCGTDYENCLDPSGKYIVNGEVVIGSTPGATVTEAGVGEPAMCPTTELYATWKYGAEQNAWCGTGTLDEYINGTLSKEVATQTSAVMTQFLANKIGYITGGKAYGMCASVLNKCQDYTYVNGEYDPQNTVVKEYLRRTLTQIKVAQDQVIADHAENCIAEVSSCLSQNGYNSDKANNNVAINSCRAAITTCMSVNGDATNGDYNSIKLWIANMLGESISGLEICSAGQVYVYNSDMQGGKCKNIADACSAFGTSGYWYNAGAYRCEKLNGSASTGECTVSGLTDEEYYPSTNTCSCPEGKVFVKATTADKNYGTGSCGEETK